MSEVNETNTETTEGKPWETLNSKMDQLLDMMTQEPPEQSAEEPTEIPIPPPLQETETEEPPESPPAEEKRNPIQRFLDWLL